jgi:hypothetical protein
MTEFFEDGVYFMAQFLEILDWLHNKCQRRTLNRGYGSSGSSPSLPKPAIGSCSKPVQFGSHLQGFTLLKNSLLSDPRSPSWPFSHKIHQVNILYAFVYLCVVPHSFHILSLISFFLTSFVSLFLPHILCLFLYLSIPKYKLRSVSHWFQMKTLTSLHHEVRVPI